MHFFLRVEDNLNGSLFDVEKRGTNKEIDLCYLAKAILPFYDIDVDVDVYLS